MKLPLGAQGVRPDERRHTMRAGACSQQRGGFKGEGYVAYFLM
ncbi:hypothetical protein [Candidatus Regiella insecticola]|nr:hypothetical protein [Candidatus Regiella insecticola]